MERFNSYQNIKTELDKYDDFAPGNLNSEKVEKLIYNFKSEQKEKWVAASQKIGELAAKGSNQLKDFIEEKLTYSVNINQQIHAFTALGSYYGYCKNPSQEEFEILNQYRDSREEGSYVQKKKKIKLDEFFDNIFKNYNLYSELTAKVDKETDSNQLEKIKEIEEEYIEDIVIDDWHLNSLVYVLDIIANKRDDIIGFLRGLIRRSHYNNIFIFNLPYLFLKIANEKENNIKKYQPLAKLILDNIEKNNIDFSMSFSFIKMSMIPPYTSFTIGALSRLFNTIPIDFRLQVFMSSSYNIPT